MSETKARKAAATLAADLAVNPTKRDADKAPTLGAWLAEYWQLVEPDLRDRTLVLQKGTGAYMVEYFGEGVRIDRISPLQAAQWRAWLATMELAEATICCHVRVAKTIFNKAIDCGILGLNPFRKLKGTAPAPAKTWRQFEGAEIDRLVAACPNAQWRALIGLCAYAGLRRGEALRLTWDDVQWDRNRLVVSLDDGEAETTKRRTREVMLEPVLATMLREVWVSSCAPDGGAPVCDGIDVNNIHRNVKVIVRRAGLEVYAKPFHTLRKHRASTWKRQYPEFVVDAWLGHSLEVSRKHYVSVPDSYYTTTHPVDSACVHPVSV